MEVTALCTVVAALRLIPNKSQFFQYESVSVICEHKGNSSGWRVKRNTSTQINADCVTNESSCNITDLYPSDSGVYWCESGSGGCSISVAINVTAGSVILESPTLPLDEGQAVSLRCRSRINSSSAVAADFYKDERLIGSSSTGSLSLRSVSESDGGLYKCSISGAGESPTSRLSVIGPRVVQSSSLAYFLLPVVSVCLLTALVLLCLWRSHKGDADQDISYTDVTVTQDVQPQRMRDDALDAGETFYSTLNLASI